MADMARFVLMYHFGGIYMDRDFYCSRPLVCLSDAVIGLIQRELSPPSKGPQTHLLIASREPLLHAVFIHNHPRTVIQDFFLATPHHPFFKWLLDLINADFIRRQLPTNASSSSSKITISEKGPFSYSIEHYLDLYYKEKNMQVKHQRQNESLLAHRWMHDQSSPGLEVIYEMHSRILHPLLDSSNQRLHTRCHQFAKKDAQLQDAEPLIKESCQLLRRGQALTTSPETAMAHMWTHSYLSKSYSLFPRNNFAIDLILVVCSVQFLT